jgi:hypothetical protein
VLFNGIIEDEIPRTKTNMKRLDSEHQDRFPDSVRVELRMGKKPGKSIIAFTPKQKFFNMAKVQALSNDNA